MKLTHSQREKKKENSERKKRRKRIKIGTPPKKTIKSLNKYVCENGY